MAKNQSKKIPLPVIGVLSLAALLLAGGGFYFFFVHGGKNPFASTGSGNGDAFYRELAEFDGLLGKQEKPETLNRALDRLEKKALGVESHLSILKRRRQLARQDPRFLVPYQRAAQEAAEALPFSESLAAVAAESLLWGNPVIEEETGAKLREYGSRISEAPLKPLALGLYILSGDLQDPFRAMAIPNKEALYSAIMPETRIDIPEPLNLNVIMDLLILRIFQGDIPGAADQITLLLQNTKLTAQNPDLPLLAAEFFYDYDNPFRAAEFFSQFSDERSMSRQAEALWLSGHRSSARNLWNLILAPEQSGTGDSPSGIKARSMYNLAVTVEEPEERIASLQRFLAKGLELLDGFNADPSYYTYGLIYYTRLLDPPQAIQILEGEKPGSHLLLDLELLRRYGSVWSLDRMTAETWLLLNRYPEDPRIYQWAAYFFDYQRRFMETALMLREAEYRRISGPWLDLHEGLRLIREGQMEAAEQELKALGPPYTAWQIPANIGRILEIRRDPGAALEYYETAAPLTAEKKSAAQLQFRISRCLKELGYDQESRQALDQSLALDPEYLSARLELQRLDRSL